MDSELLALATRQTGLLTPDQARASMGRPELATAINCGALVVVHDDVLRVAGFPVTPLSEAYAAVLQVGPGCAASGPTMGAMLQWPGVDLPARPEVVMEEDLRRRVEPQGIETRRLSHWTPAQIVLGPLGVPMLDMVDGVMTVSRHVPEGRLHTLVQHLDFTGELDVRALWRRRRRGLPGSAALTTVLRRYLLGMDSPPEYDVYRLFSLTGRPPDHLNVMVEDEHGRRGGPYDGYSELGVGYEYDGFEAHGPEEQRAVDLSKVVYAKSFGVELLRFGTGATRRPDDLIYLWLDALDRPRARPNVRVVHLPGRHCICGHRAW